MNGRDCSNDILEGISGRQDEVKKDSPKVIWISTLIIGMLIAYCGAVLVFMGINANNSYKDFELYGQTTEGTITQVTTEQGWRGEETYFTVRYTVNSMDYSYVDKKGFFGQDISEGDTVSVVYDPIQPLFAEEVKDSFGQKGEYYLIGGSAGILLGAGIALYSLKLRKA